MKRQDVRITAHPQGSTPAGQGTFWINTTTGHYIPHYNFKSGVSQGTRNKKRSCGVGPQQKGDTTEKGMKRDESALSPHKL